MTNDLLTIRTHITDSLNEAAEWIAAGEADLADESYYQGQRDVLKELLNVVDKVIKKRDSRPPENEPPNPFLFHRDAIS